LPICQIRLRAKKPLSEAYPNELKTIGDHIRKKRLDLNLYQKDLAKAFGVKEDTILNWEKGRSNPQLRYIPKVIEFLGYIPFKTTSRSEGEGILLYRLLNGLSQKELAKKLGIDQGTLRRLEKNKSKKMGTL